MKKVWTFIIKIAIAVLMIFYLLHTHYDSVVNSFKNFNLIWLAGAVFILYIEMTSCALRWFTLLKIAQIPLTWQQALSLTMRGYFCSIILPGGAIGGDVAKIGMIAHSMQKGERFEPGLSILIDRMIGMLALFIPAIFLTAADFGTLMKMDLSKIGIPLNADIYVICLILLICLAGIAATAVIFNYRKIEKIKLFKLILQKADVFTKGLVSRMKNAIDLYNKQWRILLALTVGSVFFVHIIQVGVLCCICFGLNMTIPSYLTLTTALLIGNIAGLIPLTPGGIGLRDLTIYAILQSGGFENAALISIMMSPILIFCNFSAGIFFFDKGLSRNLKYQESCNV